MTAPSAVTESQKPTVNPEDVEFLEEPEFTLKTNNHGDVKITGLKYKQYKNYPAILAAVGGESGAQRLLNGVLKNRAKAAGSAPIRLAKAEDDLQKAIAKGLEAARDYEYEERGVGVKKRLENIDKIKADIKSGAFDPTKLSPEEYAELIMSL
jgi:hypothetical protein